MKPQPDYDRACVKCGAAIYQGVLCAPCWVATKPASAQAARDAQGVQ